jgi:hypothetical protein
MKTQILIISLLFISASLLAQNDTLNKATEPTEKMIIEPSETQNNDATEGTLNEMLNGIPANDSLEATSEKVLWEEVSDSAKTDTVHIRVGKHAIEIVTNNKKTHIDVDKLDDFESRWEDRNWEQHDHNKSRRDRKNKKFNGHWGGIDFGGNLLLNTSYPEPLYPTGTPSFLNPAPEKSFEVNLNLLEYSFGFSSYFGIVTGLGLNFNDYKFKDRYTLTKDDSGVLQPLALPEGDFRLSKLSTTFITAPFMLEFQIPGQFDEKRIFITAGVIGGVKIHEHTKTQIGDEKKRDNGNYNVAPIRWGFTGRVGFENMGIFGTYYVTNLFEENSGPVTTPATVGVTLSF